LLRQAEELGVSCTLLLMPQSMAQAGDSQHRGRGWFAKSWGMIRQAVTAGPAAWRYAGRLRDVLRSIAPDLIHSNGIKTHLLVRLAKLGTTPLVWHVHDFYGERPFVRRLLRWARKGVVAVIAISEAVGRDVQTLLPGLPTRVIYNAIDVSHFSPGPADAELLDRLSGLPRASEPMLRVGLVATYARWKGQDIFLEAAARFLREQAYSPIRFYIIGGPIYHTRGSQFSIAELRKIARGLGIEASVGFIDFQQDPVSVYRALDIVIHASTRPEPFGLTIVEAMACARAVVVARAGGAAELFTDEHDAVGVVPGESAALASAISALANDPARRERFATNARLTAVRRFDRHGLGSRILEAYQGWIARP
jgi:glycosyltransferase involved in cell wall biosynthesis